MRILLLADPYIRVPPAHYGGIERVVADLATGLSKRGHEVTLWAAPGSDASATLQPFGHEGEWTTWSNARNTSLITARFWSRPGRFDVVHNFGRLAYLTGILRCRVPKLQTYMRSVNPQNIRKVAQLGARRMHFSAVSTAIRDTGLPGGGNWSVIYNCATVRDYQFNGNVDSHTAPLVFLGRLERCKGAHSAIAVAKKLKRPLRIAGNLSTLRHERDYFRHDVEPHIDGKFITYLGPVNNSEKNDLLRTAAAMLMPIEWEEPFPIVLPESLLCGTPVIAFRRGGVPEGISHGRTGFLCDTVDEMVSCVQRLHEIDRADCRAEAERRFSDSVIVDEYEHLYLELLSC